MSGRYDDIINMEHPTSARHPRMKSADRAAQFSPFAALTGYEEAVEETARLTDEKKTLTEDSISALNDKLNEVLRNIDQKPTVRLCYFVPDSRKSGGRYEEREGQVKSIDSYEGCLVFTDGTKVPLELIREIDGEIFDGTESF